MSLLSALFQAMAKSCPRSHAIQRLGTIDTQANVWFAMESGKYLARLFTVDPARIVLEGTPRPNNNMRVAD